MGLLITLYLILINTYVSVDAPIKRGFSSIESWFVGIQTSILLAILEYGTVLALKKFWQPVDFLVQIYKKKMTIDEFYKMMDLFTFILSFMYLALFNVYFWFA